MKWSQVLLENGRWGEGAKTRLPAYRQEEVRRSGRTVSLTHEHVRRKCYGVEKEGKGRWDHGQRYEEGKFGRHKERG